MNLLLKQYLIRRPCDSGICYNYYFMKKDHKCLHHSNIHVYIRTKHMTKTKRSRKTSFLKEMRKVTEKRCKQYIVSCSRFQVCKNNISYTVFGNDHMICFTQFYYHVWNCEKINIQKESKHLKQQLYLYLNTQRKLPQITEKKDKNVSKMFFAFWLALW